MKTKRISGCGSRRAVLLLAASLAFACSGRASTIINADGQWHEFAWVSFGEVGFFGGCAGGAAFEGFCSGQEGVLPAADPPWLFTIGHGSTGLLTFVGAGLPGTRFSIFELKDDDDEVEWEELGITHEPSAPDFSGSTLCWDPEVCLAGNTQWSSATFLLDHGDHTIDIGLYATAAFADTGFFRMEQMAGGSGGSGGGSGGADAPEPATMLLAGIALLAMGFLRRRCLRS